MSEAGSLYGHGPSDSSAWERRELFREYQRQRVLAMQLGDIYLALAQAYVRIGGRNRPRAVDLVVRSCEWYGLAGMTRRGQSAWRYARMIHRARWREATR